MRHIDLPKHFSKIASNREAKKAILAARDLDLDGFAVEFKRIMQAHVDHFVVGITLDDVRAAAMEWWQYLQHLRQIRTECMPLLEAVSDIAPPPIKARFATIRLPAANAFRPARSESPIDDPYTHQAELAAQNEELRRARNVLEMLLARSVDLFNLAPMNYLILSDAGLIRESNLMATALLNSSQDNLIGQPLTSFILPEDQDIFYHCCRRLWVTSERQSCELRVQRKDGEPRWVRLVTSLAPPNENDAPRWWIVLNDIAECQRCTGGGRQQERQSLHALLEQADKALFKGREAPIKC
jgi:PAS domain S-box-containing protein